MKRELKSLFLSSPTVRIPCILPEQNKMYMVCIYSNTHRECMQNVSVSVQRLMISNLMRCKKKHR